MAFSHIPTVSDLKGALQSAHFSAFVMQCSLAPYVRIAFPDFPTLSNLEGALKSAVVLKLFYAMHPCTIYQDIVPRHSKIVLLKMCITKGSCSQNCNTSFHHMSEYHSPTLQQCPTWKVHYKMQLYSNIFMQCTFKPYSRITFRQFANSVRLKSCIINAQLLSTLADNDTFGSDGHHIY